ncbi:hypothetical protein J6590_009040 [Homalodisca vitripennis]|nr:hypothetical protein J6590_009040 [Homalodisca vitripennis]
MPRSNRIFKKRKSEFYKKKVVVECESSGSGVVLEETVEDRLVESETEPSPTPNNEDTDDVVSASKVKLGNISQNYKNITDKEPNFQNDIVDFKKLINVISQIAVCKQCHQPIDFKIKYRVGLFFSGNFSCEGCNEKTLASYENSLVLQNRPNDDTKLYDINVRLVYGMRTIGRGQTAAATLCGVLNLPSPPSRFMNYTQLLGSVTVYRKLVN